MMICCSRNISDYYQFKKQLWCWSKTFLKPGDECYKSHINVHCIAHSKV